MRLSFTELLHPGNRLLKSAKTANQSLHVTLSTLLEALNEVWVITCLLICVGHMGRFIGRRYKFHLMRAFGQVGAKLTQFCELL